MPLSEAWFLSFQREGGFFWKDSHDCIFQRSYTEGNNNWGKHKEEQLDRGSFRCMLESEVFLIPLKANYGTEGTLGPGDFNELKEVI